MFLKGSQLCENDLERGRDGLERHIKELLAVICEGDDNGGLDWGEDGEKTDL